MFESIDAAAGALARNGPRLSVASKLWGERVYCFVWFLCTLRGARLASNTDCSARREVAVSCRRSRYSLAAFSFCELRGQVEHDEESKTTETTKANVEEAASTEDDARTSSRGAV